MKRIFEKSARFGGFQPSRPSRPSPSQVQSDPPASPHASLTAPRADARSPGGLSPVHVRVGFRSSQVDAPSSISFPTQNSTLKTQNSGLRPDNPHGCAVGIPAGRPTDRQVRPGVYAADAASVEFWVLSYELWKSRPCRSIAQNSKHRTQNCGRSPRFPLTAAAFTIRTAGAPSCRPFVHHTAVHSLASSPSALHSRIWSHPSRGEVHPYNHRSSIINRKWSGLRPRRRPLCRQSGRIDSPGYNSLPRRSQPRAGVAAFNRTAFEKAQVSNPYRRAFVTQLVAGSFMQAGSGAGQGGPKPSPRPS
jgi:hypothetical protein